MGALQQDLKQRISYWASCADKAASAQHSFDVRSCSTSLRVSISGCTCTHCSRMPLLKSVPAVVVLCGTDEGRFVQACINQVSRQLHVLSSGAKSDASHRATLQELHAQLSRIEREAQSMHARAAASDCALAQCRSDHAQELAALESMCVLFATELRSKGILGSDTWFPCLLCRMVGTQLCAWKPTFARL